MRTRGNRHSKSKKVHFASRNTEGYGLSLTACGKTQTGLTVIKPDLNRLNETCWMCARNYGLIYGV